MGENRPWGSTSLTKEDIARIDATGLPGLDRHYLRLLAHCLSAFQEMANGATAGPFPDEHVRLKWCQAQSSIANEEDFISVLLQQLSLAARQLEKISSLYGVSPLELTLDDLIDSSLKSTEP